MDNPSRQDRFSPKNRVVMTTMRVGMRVPAIAWRTTARAVTSRRNSRISRPARAICAWKASPPTPPATPTSTGVPTAPKVTAVLWIIIPIMTAAAAGKPMATMRGAHTAAGVPKPEAPSMKEPKSQARRMIWIRRSSLMAWKELRMAATPPERSSVFRRRRAPKMMKSRSKVRNRPWMEAAATRTHSICQTPAATATAATYTAGMAHLAGIRNPTRRTPARRMGRRARKA